MNEKLERLSIWVLGGLSLIIIFIANLGILFRYVLAHPLAWSEETIRFVFIWLIFIGAAVAHQKDALIDINMFTEKFTGKTAAFLGVIRELGCVIFLAYTGWSISFLMIDQIILGEASAAMEFPLWIVTAGMVAGTILWAVAALGKLWKSLVALTARGESNG